MSKRKNKAPKDILTARNIIASLAIILFWWAFWLGTQAPFIMDISFLSDILDSGPQNGFVLLSTWILIISVVALGIWHSWKHDYSFLKIKDKWDIVSYIVPLILIGILLITKSTAFNVPMWIYVVFMILTNFCQELLTTGFMQTGLSKTLSPVAAAIVTGTMFYLGHFMVSRTFTPMGGIMVAGFILFSWLRYKRGNIYLVNVVHLTWTFAILLTF